MNPILTGITAGTAMSLAGLAFIWPALSKGPLALLGRASVVFLGKLALVVALVLWMHGRLGTLGGNQFGISLGLTVLVLLLGQGALLAWHSSRREALGQTTDETTGDGQ